MSWNCVRDVFKKCDSEPDWDKHPIFNTENPDEGFQFLGTCKLTPSTCGKCRTHTSTIPVSELERLAKDTKLVQTVIPIDGSNKESKESKAKPKTAKAKKLEAEMAQRSLF